MSIGSGRLEAWGTRCPAAALRAWAARISGLLCSASSISSCRFRSEAAAGAASQIATPITRVMARPLGHALFPTGCLLSRLIRNHRDCVRYFTSTLNLTGVVFPARTARTSTFQEPDMEKLTVLR